jgi:hypothetical protein
VYDELRRTDPPGLRYATFVLADGVTFIHLSEFDDPLSDLPAFREFQKGLRTRCDEPPVASELREIGSFHLLSDDGASPTQ